MSSVNKVILIGNLGKDPETRYVSENNPRCTFSLATTESYTRNGERVDQTEWHNIVIWGSLAEIAQKYLHKGKQVYIEGKIRSRNYDDKEGNKRYITEIVADNFTMLGRREEGEGGQYNGSGNGNAQRQPAPQEQSQSQPQSTPQVPMEDDLPF